MAHSAKNKNYFNIFILNFDNDIASMLKMGSTKTFGMNYAFFLQYFPVAATIIHLCYTHLKTFSESFVLN